MMNDRVSALLNNLGLGRYAESFQQNAIAWDVLPELNEGDLEVLGVVLGHRKILVRAIAQLSPSAEAKGPGSLPSAVSPDTQSFPPERDQAERRQLTVLFCDLVDSTDLSLPVEPVEHKVAVLIFLVAFSQTIGSFNVYIDK
jgi:hypothetical protein